MKKQTQLWGLFLAFSLSACHYDVGLGNHDIDYLKDDQSLPLLAVPANLHMDPQLMNKTVLPAFNQQAAQTSIYPPSVLDEGGHIKPSLQQPQQTVSEHPPQETLTINADLRRSWIKVGTALKRNGYRIVDQDPLTHSFYILDVRGKGRALKETSAIYCIQLKQKTTMLTQLSVLTQSKQAAPPAITADILTAISSKLR